jgi:hypothetical protein
VAVGKPIGNEGTTSGCTTDGRWREKMKVGKGEYKKLKN